MDVNSMSLERKIGQIMVSGFHSKHFDKALRRLIEVYNMGNFILFSRNIGSKTEIAELTRAIQECELENTGIPAFICIDQEGGMVTRIREGVASMPGNMAFAAADGDTFSEGVICGKELKALGINFNLAPVLDVNNNPGNPVIGVRSYSDDERTVAKLGCRYIKGIRSSGLLAAAKHFPGHGDTLVDSHIDLPVVCHDIERLENVELFPFKEAIKHGLDAVMTAHVMFPAVEPRKLPATLSPNVLMALLRKRLGFEGLILTDCMEMKAVASYYGTAESAVMAVKAGADLIFVSHSMKLQVDCIEALKKAVVSGEIQESRIDESVNRILTFKRKYGLFENPYPDMDKVAGMVGCREHVEFARKVIQDSITLFRDRKRLLPLKAGKILAVSPRAVPLNGADEPAYNGCGFCEEVAREFGGRALWIPMNPDKEVIKEAVSLAALADVVVIGTYDAVFSEGQALLVKEVSTVNENLIVVSLRSPYDHKLFEGVSTCLCAYEYTPLSVESIIKILKGEKTASGRLPLKMF